MQHTKEPWFYSETDDGFAEITNDERAAGEYISIAEVPTGFSGKIGAEQEANARRIVACVNAFAGISTENIEENKPLAEVLRWLNERIRMAEQQRDKLLAALKECLPYISEDREYNNAVAVIAEVKGQL